MTTKHSEPTEQDEPETPKKNIAIIHPMRRSVQPSQTNDNDGGSRALEFKHYKDLHLSDLIQDDSPFTVKLSRLLNRQNNRVVKNWKHLAYECGVSSDVSASFDCDSDLSPTADLFEYMNVWKPDTTFKELKSMLKSASRNDLVLILEKGNYSDSFKISNNMEFVELFKDKLDAPRRHLDWASLAGKLKIPKKIYDTFGKPKFGPAQHLFLHIRISKKFETLTIKDLIEHLRSMERFDALKAVERYPNLQENALVRDIFQSEEAITDEISSLLNKGPMKNWKNLSNRLGIPHSTYQDFDTAKGSNRNPTGLLFQWLSSYKPDYTVGTFVKALQNIERNDVVLEIEEEILRAYKERKLQFNNSEQKLVPIVPVSSESTGEERLVQNFENLNKDQIMTLKVTDLPSTLYSKLCHLLNVPHPFFMDFRLLGEELGMDKAKIADYQKKESPMHSILVEYQLKVGDFLKIAEKIERKDAVGEVEKWLGNLPVKLDQ